jgi:hypothetical protein
VPALCNKIVSKMKTNREKKPASVPSSIQITFTACGGMHAMKALLSTKCRKQHRRRWVPSKDADTRNVVLVVGIVGQEAAQKEMGAFKRCRYKECGSGCGYRWVYTGSTGLIKDFGLGPYIYIYIYIWVGIF